MVVIPSPTKLRWDIVTLPSTKFGQNPLKDVDSRVFTRMLCGKKIDPVTLKINRVSDSLKD
jgi:hypothetical protein